MFFKHFCRFLLSGTMREKSWKFSHNLANIIIICVTDEGGTDDDQSDTSNVDNAGDDANTGDDANGGDNPVETERVALEYLGNYDDEYTNEEIEEFETFKQVYDIVSNIYNIDYTYTCVYNEAYLNT